VSNFRPRRPTRSLAGPPTDATDGLAGPIIANEAARPAAYGLLGWSTGRRDRQAAERAVNRTTAKLPGRTLLGARLFLPAALLVSVTTLPATTGGGSSSAPATTTLPGATPPSGQWPYPNGDLANTRVAPGSVISSANVSGLREAWSFKLTGQAAVGVSYSGSLTAAPVVQDGVVYLQDQDANVYALALATGQLKWEYQVDLPETSGPGPDGVAIAGATVYGETQSSVFALSAANGKTVWVDRHLLNKDQGVSRSSRRWPTGGSTWPVRRGPATGCSWP
jgi:glucose dehydrogenase